MPGGSVVFLNKDRVGHGDDELGAKLMEAFLENVGAVDPHPSHIVFMNSGVKLAVGGSRVLETLRAIEEKGVELLVCGTCLGFFGLKEKLAVGRITNQNEAVKLFMSASKVVTV
jgi:selenium metabolism protein YedF